MQQVLDWLNDPTIKTMLMLVGGFILKKWGAFFNKAIPLTLLAVSVVLAALKALFPLLVPAAHALVAQVPLATPHRPWWMVVLVDILLPVVSAIGVQSGIKNTGQYLAGDRKTT